MMHMLLCAVEICIAPVVAHLLIDLEQVVKVLDRLNDCGIAVVLVHLHHRACRRIAFNNSLHLTSLTKVMGATCAAPAKSLIMNQKDRKFQRALLEQAALTTTHR